MCTILCIIGDPFPLGYAYLLEVVHGVDDHLEHLLDEQAQVKRPPHWPQPPSCQTQFLKQLVLEQFLFFRSFVKDQSYRTKFLENLRYYTLFNLMFYIILLQVINKLIDFAPIWIIINLLRIIDLQQLLLLKQTPMIYYFKLSI